jgi:hypothetical protein
VFHAIGGGALAAQQQPPLPPTGIRSVKDVAPQCMEPHEIH